MGKIGDMGQKGQKHVDTKPNISNILPNSHFYNIAKLLSIKLMNSAAPKLQH